jgi:uncharacterized protein YgbK (DUF1537 family)
MRVLVIADDFTGAAELGAAGMKFGLGARVVHGLSGAEAAGTDLVLIDTNSRLLPADSAVRAVEQSLQGVDLASFDVIYKKTDSVLRGPVAAEVEAVARIVGKRGGMLCPWNPSKGRVIVDGVYRVGGVPIAESQFARDPNYPATSSKAFDLLNRDGRASKQICEQRLILGEGADAEKLLHWAGQTGVDLLPAGGVEFFEAVLRTHGLSPQALEKPRMTGQTLIVLGSACDSSRAFLKQLNPHLVCMLPECDLAYKFARFGLAVLAFPDRFDRTLPKLLVDIVAGIHNVDTLLIEGGSTAAAIFDRLDWHAFDVRGEFAPGVAVLQPVGGGPTVAVKPGSYPWPPKMLEATCSAAPA